LAPDARHLLDDPSPLIRGAAVWALSRLVSREEFIALRRGDADVGVMEEWAAQRKY
jgi:epoxyqueuosine reductase